MTTAYPQGTFCWTDLQTTDGAAAKAFYTSLFDWDGQDTPLPYGGVYTMLQQDGKDIAGLGEMQKEQIDQGMPPVWNSYVAVDDAEAVAARATELGATVIAPAFDVMDAGRMAVIQDPTGAIFALWQTGKHKGSDLFNVPNSLGWNELATGDVEAAKTFYTALFGWEAETDDNGYTAFLNNGRMNGGMMALDPSWGDVPPHWAIYLAVADCAATAQKAQELGGTIVRPPFDIGDIGTIAVLQDPQGGTFMVIRMNQTDEPLT